MRSHVFHAALGNVLFFLQKGSSGLSITTWYFALLRWSNGGKVGGDASSTKGKGGKAKPKRKPKSGDGKGSGDEDGGDGEFHWQVPTWQHVKCFLMMGVWTSTLANMPESDTLSAKDHATINALLKPFAKDSLPGNVACLIQLAN
jgi:hypothetical protein